MMSKLNEYIVKNYIRQIKPDKKTLSDIEIERIAVGLNILLSEIEKIILIGFIMLCFGKVKEMIVSMIVLKCIRLFSGGIHMKKEYQCFIVTFIFFVSVAFFSDKVYLSSYASIVIHIFTFVIVLIHTCFAWWGEPDVSEKVKEYYSKEKARK